MIMVVKKNKIKNNQGQAVFEFLMFLPIMLLTYALVTNFVAAINGSINQQKISRGYFYARVKNNSRHPSRDTLSRLKNGINRAGMVSLGFKEKFDGGSLIPIATCYKLVSFFAPTNNDQCEDKLDGKITTQFVRVKTGYGYCGSTYIIKDGGLLKRSALYADEASCHLTDDGQGDI